MPIDPLSPPPTQGPPSPPPRKLLRLPRAGLSVGVAAGLAFGGAGIAFAATSVTSSSHASSSPSPSATTVPGPGPGGKVGPSKGPFGRGLGKGFGRLGGIVHGEVTVPNGSGGYKTVELQVGKVTSVNQTSITVTSADGYQHTYAVASTTIVDAQAGGISSVAGGDQVRLMASTSSGKDTAMDIQDVTKIGDSRKGFGFAPGKRSGQRQPEAPAAQAGVFAN